MERAFNEGRSTPNLLKVDALAPEDVQSGETADGALDDVSFGRESGAYHVEHVRVIMHREYVAMDLDCQVAATL
jgi:hypothetical protein